MPSIYCGLHSKPRKKGNAGNLTAIARPSGFNGALWEDTGRGRAAGEPAASSEGPRGPPSRSGRSGRSKRSALWTVEENTRVCSVHGKKKYRRQCRIPCAKKKSRSSFKGHHPLPTPRNPWRRIQSGTDTNCRHTLRDIGCLICFGPTGSLEFKHLRPLQQPDHESDKNRRCGGDLSRDGQGV